MKRLLTALAALSVLPACTLQLHGLAGPGALPPVEWEGTWTGMYQCPTGVARVETLQLTRRGRNLVATKLTADECVPAGVKVWEAVLPKPVVYANELPLSAYAVIAISSSQRVRGQLTIVGPDRMVLEGAERIELARGTTAPQAAAPAAPAGPPSAPAPVAGQPEGATPAVASTPPLATAPVAKADGRIRKANWRKQLKTEGVRDRVAGVTYGDLDGDGQEEAAVTTSTDRGSGSYLYTMPGKAVTSFTMPFLTELDNMEVVSRDCAIVDGRLVLTYTYGEAICCPDRELTVTFAFRGGKWVEDRTQRKLKQV